ncbi:type I secretion system permease/ATPase [Rubellimicrobium roseum]|nr:type I secretion system permease/ATPase [Rubellimicrobium roseum]
MNSHFTTITPQPRAVFLAAWRNLRRTCVAVFGFSIVLNVLMLTGSIYMLQVYDRVLTSQSVETLLALFAIVVVLYAFLGFFDFLRARILGLAAVRLDLALGAGAFAQLLRQGLPGVPRAGQPVAAPSQPLQNLDTVRGFLSGGAVGALFDAPLVPLYLVVLYLVHPMLCAVTIAGALVTAALAWANHLLTRDAIDRTLAGESAERELAERSRRGAEAIFGMGMQGAVVSRWQGLRNVALAAGQRSGHPAEMIAATSRAFRMLLQSAILSAGAWLVIQGEITGGMIIASSILSGKALGPVDQIIGNWRAIQRAARARDALRRSFADAPDTLAVVDLPEPQGHIELRDVTKLAPPSANNSERRPLLDEVGFSLEPGDGLAIVGPSGSGKSTLARVLMGIVTPDAGEVRLDGATLDQWAPERLGRHLGYLPQLPDLLPGTARDHIARFDPSVTDEMVIEAAKVVGIHELILSLPKGYATEVGGAGGATLSGGQMQRLGLARAICGRPKVVVLDEPNAHLDAAGDEALARVITLLRRAGSVVIVVTHRPAALAVLNKALVLKDGRVERFGPVSDVLGPTAVLPANDHIPLAPAAMPARLGWEPVVVQAAPAAENLFTRLANVLETAQVPPHGADVPEADPPMPRRVAQAMARLGDQSAAGRR